MSLLLEIDADSIVLLKDYQLTELLKILLHLEADAAGIAQRSVDVGLNINVPDGGEDGRIEWEDGPENTSMLPVRLVQFQVKATDMGPKKCSKEIIDKNGMVKPMVDNALSSGGAYIIFNSRKVNRQGKKRRIDSIREKLNELEKPYADTAIIEVYDAGTIQGWVNKYFSAVVAVSSWIKRPLIAGMQSWKEWAAMDDFFRFGFVPDEKRSKAIEQLRDQLSEPRKVARLVGLSGLGKTRLAFETLRPTGNIDYLHGKAVYIDASYGVKALAARVSDWVRCQFEGILVIDNCDLGLHKKLKVEVSRADSKFSMLTIDYDLEQDPGTPTIRLGALEDSFIKQMLEPVYGETIRDLDRIISFAQGFPQMAVLLVDARLDREPEMGSLTDDDLAHRMLWGGREPVIEDEKILKGCALFDRFGLDDEASPEYEFIAREIVEVDLDDFYDCVKRFEERGLINRRGRYAKLVPKPLAIRLAAEWWRRTRPQKQIELIQSELPGALVDSFCDQISRLDFLPEVKSLTEDLCGPQSPFGQAEVILSNRGSRLFRSLVEVNPLAISRALSNILHRLNEVELFAIAGDVRRNLVRALEKLCFHEICFEEAANSLLLLASNENESWSNNSTGLFKQLFRTFLSGTEAPPHLRLKVIDSALESGIDSVRKLVIEALEKAIDIYGGTRMLGAEYQGSGEPLREWRPKVWGDAFEYWEQALERLCNLVVEKDPFAPLAKNLIANNIRGLMQYGRVNILDTVIRKIINQDGPLWPAALNSIKDSLRYEGSKIPDEGKIKLQEWVSLLTPTDLGDRLNLIVTNPPYEHKKEEDGRSEDIAAKNAKLLAEELATDMDSIVPFVDSLLVGDQRQAYWFGKNLVESACKWEPLLSEVIKKIVSIEDSNINLLLGILNGIFNLNTSEWNTIVKLFFDEENLNQYYAHTVVTGNVTIEQLNCLTELIAQNKIEPIAAKTLTYGRPLEHLNYNDTVQFVKNLVSISDNSAWIALDILSMYCYGDSEKWNNCKPTFKEIVVTLKLDRKDKKQNQLEMHHWHDVVKKLLQDDDTAFAIDITRQILASCTDELSYGDLWHYIQPIIRIIFQKHAKDVWPLFSETIINVGPVEEYRLMQLLGSGSSFDKKKPSVLSDLPDEIFKEWCLQNPEKAPEFVAQTTEVLLEIDDKYQISPRAQFLIDNFGDNEQVLSELSATLSSFGWSGSLVPYLKKEAEALEGLKDHNNINVRNWVNRRLDYLSKMIERETRRDEEHDWGIY